jgi:hypothetical protein
MPPHRGRHIGEQAGGAHLCPVDSKRHTLAEDLHRMEAIKWLGGVEIDVYLMQAQKH